MPFRLRTKTLSQIFLLFVLLGLLGCYRTSRYRTGKRIGTDSINIQERGLSKDSQLNINSRENGQTDFRRRYPWEAFVLFHDLQGRALQDYNMLKGDELLERASYKKALSAYQSAKKRGVREQERDALVARLASTELVLKKPQKALDALSAYFTTLNSSVDQVGPVFSLLFGYVYGLNNDVDQSLAWFARAYRLSKGYGGIADAAEKGVRFSLRALPSENYQNVKLRWDGDDFVRDMFGKESRRRAQGGPQAASLSQQIEMVMQPPSIPSYEKLDGAIAVLLPLTGRFAALGQKTKEGIQLALEGQGNVNVIKVQYADTQADPVTTATQVRKLQAAGVTTFIGPLLKETSNAAMSALRSSSGSMLILSKHNDFVTQRGIFRLGPSIDSQVSSLLEVSSSVLKLRNFAIVYPDDVTGRESVDIFKSQLSQKGLNLAYEVGYVKGDSSRFAEIGEELEFHKFDALFFPDSLHMARRFLTSLSPKLRKSFRLLGSAKWDRPSEVKRSRDLMLRALYVSPFFTDSTNEYITQFKDSYRARFGKQANFLAAQGFDAATLTIAALKRRYDRNVSFDQALKDVNLYEGLTGIIKVGFESDLLRRFKVVEIDYDGVREVG